MGYLHLLGAEIVSRHLISPNLHVILVHFPLGIFTFGLFLEVVGLLLWRRSSARLAAQWMILFGGLLAVPAALTGLDAIADATGEGTRISEKGFELVHKHLVLASVGAGLAALAVTIGLALPERQRRRILIYAPLLVILISAAVLMTFGSHFGGEGIYLQGVAVKIKGEASTGIEYWAPARSMHLLLAGLAFAVTLGALGASVRVLWSHRDAQAQAEAEAELESLQSGTLPPRRVTDDISVARTLNADAVIQPRVPGARFWLLGFLLFLAAFGFGVWFLISLEDTTFFDKNPHVSAKAVWNEVVETGRATSKDPKYGTLQNRRGAHIVLGCALIVLPLLLAAAVRWGPRHRIIVGALCALMLLVAAAELWLGVLLIRDRDPTAGPLYRFNPEPASQALLGAPKDPFPALKLAQIVQIVQIVSPCASSAEMRKG